MNQSSNTRNGVDGNNVGEGSRNNENTNARDKPYKYGRVNGQTKTTIIVDSLKDYTWEEKFEWMHQKKLKGNRLFTKKKYDAAIQMYQEAFLAIDLNCPTERKQRVINEIQIPCLLNTASCLKQKREYLRGLDACNKALDLNRENYLSYIRRGIIYQAMREYDKALSDFRHAKDLNADEPSLALIAKAVEDIKAAQENPRKTQREFVEEGSLYQDITFDESNDRITVQESKSNIEEEGPKVLHYNDDLEELNRYGVFKYIAYPIKMSFKFIKDKTMWCRRRRRGTNYEMADTESGQA